VDGRIKDTRIIMGAAQRHHRDDCCERGNHSRSVLCQERSRNARIAAIDTIGGYIPGSHGFDPLLVGVYENN
jgi:hypothetical protein